MIRFAAIFCLIASAAAAQPGAADARRADTAEKLPPEQYHFLFVVDTSISMAPRKAVSIEMMRELIASGFVGQARNGDSIDIWLYDQENDISRFPPQIWDEADGRRIADTAARFVEQLQFKGRSRFAPVARDLNALLPNAKKLLVVILTDGEEPLSGISFDIEINDYVAKLKKSMVPNHPIHLSLAAVQGRFERWAVYNGDGKDDLVALPPRSQSKPLVAKAIPKTTNKKAEPKKTAEPEKKSNAKPITWELPPGARLASPPPAPEPTNSVAATNHLEVTAQSAPPTAVTPPPSLPATKAAQPAAIVSTPLTSNPVPAPAGETAPPPTTVLTQSKPAVVPQAVPQVSQVTHQPKPLITSNAVAVAPRAHDQTAPTTNIPVVAKITPSGPAAPNPPGPVLAANPLVTAALFAGLALAGLAIVALAALLFLKRAKARQDGSIISQSLLR